MHCRYFHNIKTTHAPACMHIDETKVNNNTFAKYAPPSRPSVFVVRGGARSPRRRRVWWWWWEGVGGGWLVSPQHTAPLVGPALDGATLT